MGSVFCGYYFICYMEVIRRLVWREGRWWGGRMFFRVLG